MKPNDTKQSNSGAIEEANRKETAPDKAEQQDNNQKRESLWTILFSFLKVGAFTFGGGYAILPVIQAEVVEKRRWVSQAVFSDILIITQGMPGQLALNSAIQIGMRLRGTLGGLVAALGVTAPSVVIILAIASYFYPLIKDNIYVQAVFYGLRPAVVALIAAAAVKMGREILHGLSGILLCAALLILAILSGLHPIFVLVVGGLAGIIVFKKGAR